MVVSPFIGSISTIDAYWILVAINWAHVTICYHLLTFEEQVAFEDFRSLFQQLEQGRLRDAGGGAK